MTNALYAAPAQTVANAKAMRLSGYRLLKISRAVGDMSGAAWGRNYDAKMWIINWLEQYCDYAMTIDMPLWAATEHGTQSRSWSPFKTNVTIFSS